MKKTAGKKPSHSCSFIEDKKVICISDYICLDCNEHKSRFTKINEPRLMDWEKVRAIFKYHIEAYGGKLNPKDNFDGFIFDMQNALKSMSEPSLMEECPAYGSKMKFNTVFKKESDEFWKEIIYKDGKIDEEQVLKELADHYFMLEEIPKVYCHATGGLLSSKCIMRPLSTPLYQTI